MSINLKGDCWLRLPAESLINNSASIGTIKYISPSLTVSVIPCTDSEMLDK